MQYLTFLLLFVAPPIALLWSLQVERNAPRRFALPAVCVLALAYTTPWDNYLVAQDVWSYGTDRVLFTIGYVPFEEYLFFVLQPWLAGLTALRLLEVKSRAPVSASRTIRFSGAGLFVLIALLGAALLIWGNNHSRYLGLILAWATPPMVGMWYYGGDLIWSYRRVFGTAVLLPTLYLWIIDRLAIGWGIWQISDRFSLNWDPLGLPIEEAVFFLMTNLLCVAGLFLFRFGPQIGCLREYRSSSH